MLTIVNFNYVMEKRGWTRGRFEQQGGFQENQQAGTYNNPKLYPKPYPKSNPNINAKLKRTLSLNFELS